MKLKILNLVVFAVIWCSAPVFSAPADLWFTTANAWYEKQSYDSAVVYYQKIVDAGIQNHTVYYNLGNTFFRLNKLGSALLYYEKARKLAPNDQDILTNIRFAQLNIIDRVAEPERSFFETILWRLHTMLSLHSQMWLLWGCLMALSIFFAVSLFASHNLRLWLIYLGTIGAFIAFALSISVGVKVYDLEKKEFAIVLEKNLDARNQPDGDKILFSVHEGTKFLIKKTVDTWSFVSLPNGVSGWVRNDALGKI